MEALDGPSSLAILDDLTANLAELKATLAPLALIAGTVVSEARKSASVQRRAAMRVQGQYMSAIRTLSAVQREQVKKLRAAKGAEAAIALVRRLRR